MDDILDKFKTQTDTSVQILEEELKGIRTGRANSGMVENMIVHTYGGSTSLKLRELATITTEGPVTLAISPFDPATVKDIEKAILTSPIGINPQTEGVKIYLRIPPMSEEQRKRDNGSLISYELQIINNDHSSRFFCHSYNTCTYP